MRNDEFKMFSKGFHTAFNIRLNRCWPVNVWARFMEITYFIHNGVNLIVK